MLATDILKQHHREIEELLQQLKYPNEPVKTRENIRIELVDVIAAHSVTEEDLFYPVALDLLGSSCRVLEATDEHSAIGFLLVNLMTMNVTDEGFGARLEVIGDIFLNHIEEEETELFAEYESECERENSEKLGSQLQERYEELLKRGHVAVLSERVRLPKIDTKRPKKSHRRGQFKPLSIVSLPRVFVNLLALEDEEIVIFAEALNKCEEMKTWFVTTKTIVSEELPPLPTNAANDDSAEMVELRVRRALAEFFRAVLALSKVTRAMFVKDFDRLLNDLECQDFFGTEGQCDPRGDHRD